MRAKEREARRALRMRSSEAQASCGRSRCSAASRRAAGTSRPAGWCAAASRRFVNGASSTSPAGRSGRV